MILGRRKFLSLCGFGAAGVLSPSFGLNVMPLKPLKVRREEIRIGLERPFSVLHVSDSHLMRIDSRDGDALYEFAKARSRNGRELGEYYLDEAVHNARLKKMKIVHTGDFMDFVSEANLEYASRRLCTDDFLAGVGNHEYWVGAKHLETEEYKQQTIPKLRRFWTGIPASTYLIKGINFFVFDNSFETVTREVVAAFERTVVEGRPIVMVCHVPLWSERCGLNDGVCGMPGLKKDDEVSCSFVEMVRNECLVKAILAGHVHVFKKFDFSPTAVELVAGALFDGCCTEVVFM